MNPLLKAALRYAEQGWGVIPISPTSKKPLVKWKQFQERVPTENEIRSWWAARPSAQIAVLTGRLSGILVVDIDPRHGGVPDDWQSIHPSTLRVGTKHGGQHFYYAHPGNGRVANSAGKLGPGIDVRGDGGYVLAPPSSGYSWLERGGLPSSNGVFKPRHTHEVEPHPAPVIETEHWIERLLGGVSHGERNSAAARLAGYFLGKGSPVDVVVAQLQAWNRLNDPPLPESEIRTTVESVDRTAKDRPKRSHSFQVVGEDEEDSGGYDLISFSAYLSKYGNQAIRWMVQDWLPTETVGMVVAPPGSYKTWLLQDLAISVATGMPYLGQFPVMKSGPVLFMQQEDYHGQIAHRFALITSRRADIEAPRMVGSTLIVQAPPYVPIHLHEHRRFRFDDEAIVQDWVEKLRRIRPVLCILDPLYSAGSVDDFMAGTARSMFLFKSIRDQFRTSFLIAHHTRKAERGGKGEKSSPANAIPDREDTWGSQFLNAWIETGWQIRRREELGSATISRHFKVQSEAARAVVSFHIDTTVMPGKYDVAVKEITPGEKEEGADLARILEISGPSSIAELAKVTGIPRATVYRRLEVLIEAGQAEKHGNDYSLTERLDT